MNPDRLKTSGKITTLKAKGAKNESGLRPCGLKVLVLPDEIEEKTVGGIIITQQTRENESFAVESGVLVAKGGGAFTDWPNSSDQWPGEVPQVGDRVVISKYAGLVYDGADGKKYRFLNDTDIAGFEVDGEAK